MGAEVRVYCWLWSILIIRRRHKRLALILNQTNNSELNRTWTEPIHHKINQTELKRNLEIWNQTWTKPNSADLGSFEPNSAHLQSYEPNSHRVDHP